MGVQSQSYSIHNECVESKTESSHYQFDSKSENVNIKGINWDGNSSFEDSGVSGVDVSLDFNKITNNSTLTKDISLKNSNINSNIDITLPDVQNQTGRIGHNMPDLLGPKIESEIHIDSNNTSPDLNSKYQSGLNMSDQDINISNRNTAPERQINSSLNSPTLFTSNNSTINPNVRVRAKTDIKSTDSENKNNQSSKIKIGSCFGNDHNNKKDDANIDLNESYESYTSSNKRIKPPKSIIEDERPRKKHKNGTTSWFGKKNIDLSQELPEESIDNKNDIHISGDQNIENKSKKKEKRT